jgi:hypothetical protein
MEIPMMSPRSMTALLPFLLLVVGSGCTMAGQPGTHPGIAEDSGSTAPAASGRPTAEGALPRDVALRPGEGTELEDHARLRYLRLVNDSRCDPDVQCVWAGDAEIELEWRPPNGEPEVFSLHTGKAPREQVLGLRRVTLLALDRGAAPLARLRVEGLPAGQ